MKEITVTYEVTPDDYNKYGKENASAQEGYHPTVIMLLIMYALFIFSDLIYSIFFGALKEAGARSLLTNILIRFCLSFFLILTGLSIINLIINRKKKQVSEMGKNAICCEHKLILKENELVEITDLFTNRTSWTAIGEIKESSNYLFFGSATAFIYLIPKRYFDSPEILRNFVDTFNIYRQKSLNEYSRSYFAVLEEKQNEK